MTIEQYRAIVNAPTFQPFTAILSEDSGSLVQLRFRETYFSVQTTHSFGRHILVTGKRDLLRFVCTILDPYGRQITVPYECVELIEIRREVGERL